MVNGCDLNPYSSLFTPLRRKRRSLSDARREHSCIIKSFLTIAVESDRVRDNAAAYRDCVHRIDSPRESRTFRDGTSRSVRLTEMCPMAHTVRRLSGFRNGRRDNVVTLLSGRFRTSVKRDGRLSRSARYAKDRRVPLTTQSREPGYKYSTTPAKWKFVGENLPIVLNVAFKSAKEQSAPA